MGDLLTRCRQRSRWLLLLVPITSLCVGIGVAWALAGVGHTRADFYHGIFGGADCTSTMKNCAIESYVRDTDGTYSNAYVDASLRHLRDDGGYNEQCRDSHGNEIVAYCWGVSGTAPCRKYAFTQAFDPTSDMPWHRMNPSGCDGTVDP